MTKRKDINEFSSLNERYSPKAFRMKHDALMADQERHRRYVEGARADAQRIADAITDYSYLRVGKVFREACGLIGGVEFEIVEIRDLTVFVKITNRGCPADESLDEPLDDFVNRYEHGYIYEIRDDGATIPHDTKEESFDS